MEKITFVNNDAPYLSAENLNQLQNNVEEAIDGVVIWENLNLTEEFPSQQIDISLYEYKKFDVVYLINPVTNYYVTQHINRRPITSQQTAITYYNDMDLIVYRNVMFGNSYIFFGQCYGYGIASSAQQGFVENADGTLIPYRIIAYK